MLILLKKIFLDLKKGAQLCNRHGISMLDLYDRCESMILNADVSFLTPQILDALDRDLDRKAVHTRSSKSSSFKGPITLQKTRISSLKSSDLAHFNTENDVRL